MDPLAPLIASLNADGRLRVWSLVITVFGDSIEPRGGSVSTARLQRLLGRIGVEPGALRTALSRLSRDGWVEGTRAGRISHYRLTPSGRARFTDATSRIYAPPTPATDSDADVGAQGWTLIWQDPPDPRHPQIGGLTLRPAADPDAAQAPAAFRMTGRITALSDTLRATLLPDPQRTALARLGADLAALTPPAAAALSPLDAAAARTLLIHRWRRIVLRYPDWPTALLPPDWAELPPRAAVAGCWQALTPAAEQWWTSQSPELPALPRAEPAFFQRFQQPGA